MRRFWASSALAGILATAAFGCSGRNQRQFHAEPFGAAHPRAARTHPEPLIDRSQPVETNDVPVTPAVAKSEPEENLERAFAVTPGNAPQSTERARTPSLSTPSPTRPKSGSAMDHDPEYAWVQGRLEYSAMGGGLWRVRYAPLSVEDRYGGGIVLDAPPDTNRFKSGDTVYVEGQIISERGHRGLNNPLYRAHRMSLVGEQP